LRLGPATGRHLPRY